MVSKHRPGPDLFRAGRFAALRLTVFIPDFVRADSRKNPDFDDGTELAEYLLELVADPLVREAIEVSSVPLADTIAKVESGLAVPLKKIRRAVLSVTRYLLRMAGRPTPFGIHAGVAVVQIGSEAKARIGDQHVKRVRPDSEWLAVVLERLRRLPEVRDSLTVVANNLCERRGDRLVLPYVRRRGTDPDDAPVERQVSVGYSQAVAAAVENSSRPICYRDLRELLLGAFPGVSAAVVDTMLDGLLEREILLTDLASRLDRPDQFDDVLHRVQGLDLHVPEAVALTRIGSELKRYESLPLGQGRDSLRAVAGQMAELHRTKQPPVHVDLRVDADVRLPQTLADEVARVANVLWRLSPPGSGMSTIDRYHDEFLERYGADRLVPVQELLDPHLGLGPPGGFRNPPADRSLDPLPGEPYPARRDELLAERLPPNGRDELVLDDDFVERLAVDSDPKPDSGSGSDEQPPDSLDVCVQLFADSAGSLLDGSYIMALSPLAGSVTAGAMCGRFTDLLEAREQLTDVFQSVNDDRLPAQLFYQPARLRHRNRSVCHR